MCVPRFSNIRRLCAQGSPVGVYLSQNLREVDKERHAGGRKTRSGFPVAPTHSREGRRGQDAIGLLANSDGRDGTAPTHVRSEKPARVVYCRVAENWREQFIHPVA